MNLNIKTGGRAYGSSGKKIYIVILVKMRKKLLIVLDEGNNFHFQNFLINLNLTFYFYFKCVTTVNTLFGRDRRL